MDGRYVALGSGTHFICRRSHGGALGPWWDSSDAIGQGGGAMWAASKAWSRGSVGFPFGILVRSEKEWVQSGCVPIQARPRRVNELGCRARAAG
jgi:hypothetical protein